MTSMGPPPRDQHRRKVVTRRELLRVVGGTGVAAIVSACTYPTRPSTTTAPSVGRVSSLAATTVPATSTLENPIPLSSAPPAPTPQASGVMLCREAWGARPPVDGGIPHTISRMTIHHTGTVLGDNRNSPARLRQHQHYHQDERGWIDIAYHVGVDRNGNIFELRTPTLVGDTATNYDPTGHFLVLCEGDFDQETVTDAQIDGAALAFAWAAQFFSIPADTLAGHRDLASTSCPGADLYARVASGDLQQRIDTLLAAGNVELQRICGPEAAARVAAIEAKEN